MPLKTIKTNLTNTHMSTANTTNCKLSTQEEVWPNMLNHGSFLIAQTSQNKSLKNTSLKRNWKDLSCVRQPGTGYFYPATLQSLCASKDGCFYVQYKQFEFVTCVLESAHICHIIKALLLAMWDGFYKVCWGKMQVITSKCGRGSREGQVFLWKHNGQPSI